jgi:CheY-like chemotaxis protein
MTRHEIRQRASLIEDYGTLPPVAGNAARLGQAIVNLLANAAQAVPPGSPETHAIHVVSRSGANGEAIVEIHDTGRGIPPADRERVFDPFYSTKPLGAGVGLGLSMTHAIVSSHGGTIELLAAPERGTIARITLPAAPPQDPTPVERPAAAAAKASRRGHVLVVDDEPGILAVVERMLERHHDVIGTTDARAALRMLTDGEAAGRAIDVVLCDLLMPDMSGMELFDAVQAASPELAERFIFATGGAFTAAAREFLERVPNPRLEKPFILPHLLGLIARRV